MAASPAPLRGQMSGNSLVIPARTRLRMARRAGVHTGRVRIAVRVRPGSTRPGVGGEHDGALVVRVSEPAADGKATAAVLASVAVAFGVGRRSVMLVTGARSRVKILDVAGADPRTLERLLAQ